MQTEILGSYYTLQETAEKLRIAPNTLRHWIKSGEIACYKTKGKYLFSEKDILDKLNKNRINNENE
jgi:excisionase family DNA binding protein